MPDSNRSSVDLPAPLCPTSPTRSPICRDMVMSRNASTTTTLDSLRPMLPPALPRNAFFSDRDLASKLGSSTPAFSVEMNGLFDTGRSSVEHTSGPPFLLRISYAVLSWEQH